MRPHDSESTGITTAIWEEPVLATDEIQGNVLPGFGTARLVLLGVKFGAVQPDAVRAWLRSLLPSISTLQDVTDLRVARRARSEGGEESAHAVVTNIALDRQGLSVLVPELTAIEDSAFLQGMSAESGLGDPRQPAHDGHASRWVVGGLPERTPDALVLLGSDGKEELDEAAARAKDAAVAAGLSVIYCQEGHQLDGEIEHFGFRDGVSQAGSRGRLSEAPDDYLTGRSIKTADPRSALFGRPGQPLVWPGQFLFGYPKQQADDPLNPGSRAEGGYDWMVNGSFLVFRRLRQDVPAFRQFLLEEAARLRTAGLTDMTPERLAALLVGRWPKGTALVRNPSKDDEDPMGDRYQVNHFGYAEDTPPIDVFDEAEPPVTETDAGAAAYRSIPGAIADPFGSVCPKFAHIRKVNPRDLSTDMPPPSSTLTVGVLRRGIPWGEPYAEGTEAQAGDDGDRGLLFLCYQTSIERQFKFLNTNWMNNTNKPEAGVGHDLLVGQGSGKDRKRTARLPTPNDPGGEIATLSHWVIPTGGGFFFSPSVKALRGFAGM